VVFGVIADPEALASAHQLLNERYAWRGYGSSHAIPIGPNHTTFAARLDGDVVGVITLTLDSDEGLSVERTFSAEVESVRRARGARVCELTKLAFRGGSKPRLAALFDAVFAYGAPRFDATDVLIEVNPRHVGVYAATLGFERLGPIRLNAAVGAPSQLMRLTVDGVRQRLAEPQARRRSLYAHFAAAHACA